MSRAENCPEFWDRILLAVGTPCVVAGGCVRDYHAGIEAKDIDVFVPHDWLGSIGKRIRTIRPDVVGYVFAGSDPTVAWIETYKFEGWEVQVIGLKLADFNSYTVMKRMDLGLCQCSYDGAWDFTPRYWEDQRANAISVVRADNQAQHDTSVLRAKRIKDRAYPTFTIKPHKDFLNDL